MRAKARATERGGAGVPIRTYDGNKRHGRDGGRDGEVEDAGRPEEARDPRLAVVYRVNSPRHDRYGRCGRR